MRLIDIVYLKGSVLEMRLFTYDLDITKVENKGTFREELNWAVTSGAISETIKQKIILDQKEFNH